MIKIFDYQIKVNNLEIKINKRYCHKMDYNQIRSINKIDYDYLTIIINKQTIKTPN